MYKLIKNIYQSTPIDIIQNEVEILLFAVKQVTHIVNRIFKNPFRFFFCRPETHRSNKKHF